MTIHVFGDSFSDEPVSDEEPSRWIHLLREKYGTDNVTDTVFECLKELYLQYGNNN